MEREIRAGQIVFTNKARCRDCNRCVRVCPVKAIRITGGQAFVEPERCISCGTCIRECPQGAKSFRNDVALAERLAVSGAAAASLAPSFPAEFEAWELKRLPSALRRLGFTHVSETAVGAYFSALKTRELLAEEPERTVFCSACPALVNYVEMYRPADTGLLAAAVSPMVAHARHLREKLGPSVPLVFIGPCVTKKAEAEREEYRGLIDCVLTFSELREWLTLREIDLKDCEESGFDEQPAGASRFYPLEGGGLRTAAVSIDPLDVDTLLVSGFTEINEALDAARADSSPRLVEPLFCRHGCIAGPGMSRRHNVYERRAAVLEWAAAREDTSGEEKLPAGLDAVYHPRIALHDPVEITDEMAARVLERTGQVREEDRLNCGACGYGSCRERAEAVIRGLAEPEMCIPYMRRLAEQRKDRIIETSPNGIVILDGRLQILSTNPAFRRFFLCSEAICGRHISTLMDPEPFERLASGREEKVEMTAQHQRYNLVCRQILYRLPGEDQFVGIFVNITGSRESQEKLERLREQTFQQARELLEHQIGTAQEIARFLGESTARGQVLVENILRLAGNSRDSNSGGKGFTPWDTGISK